MLNKKNTKLTFNEVFQKGNEEYRSHRSAGIISSKQMVFYTQIEPEKYNGGRYYPSHWGIVDLLYSEIEPLDNQSNKDNDVHLFSWDTSLTIDLANSGHLSMMQAIFLIDILNQVEILNNQIENESKKIYVGFYTYNPKYDNTFFDPFDILKMKKTVLKLVDNNIELEKENIVGKTLSDEEIITALKYHLNPRKYHNSKELIDYKKILQTFYQDDYFNHYLLSIIPNIDRVVDLINKVIDLNIKLPLISLERIENDLQNIISSLDEDEHHLKK